MGVPLPPYPCQPVVWPRLSSVGAPHPQSSQSPGLFVSQKREAPRSRPPILVLWFPAHTGLEAWLNAWPLACVVGGAPAKPDGAEASRQRGPSITWKKTHGAPQFGVIPPEACMMGKRRGGETEWEFLDGSGAKGVKRAGLLVLARHSLAFEPVNREGKGWARADSPYIPGKRHVASGTQDRMRDSRACSVARAFFLHRKPRGPEAVMLLCAPASLARMSAHDCVLAQAGTHMVPCPLRSPGRRGQ